MNPDRDVAFAPELHDAVLAAMTGTRSMNPAAIDKARREKAESDRRDERPPMPHEDLAEDLELGTVWSAMAAGDPFLFEAARRCVLSSIPDPEVIVYRQRALVDCLEHPEVIRELYALALHALENERTVGWLWRGAGVSPILHRSVQVLTRQVGVFRRLRDISGRHRHGFRSEAFLRFFAMVDEEMSDDYLARVEGHLDELKFARGLLESATLGPGLKGRGYIVRRPPHRGWSERLPFRRRGQGSFQVHPRDESGARALEDLRARGLNGVADAVAQSADHVRSFFTMLRLELAFYLGCVNLHTQLAAKGEPVCFPVPLDGERPSVDTQGLYDVSLSLHVRDRLVGNDLAADGKSLVVITGANQGGKSTLLRAVGLAQLMMQSGMFVGARTFSADVRTQVHTHFAREEDPGMHGGKLDEELRRMSEIARTITPGALLVCNESFSSTNEREGSEIARQVVRAMLERGIKVVFVTHMYDLAHGLRAEGLETALFLRAERGTDGRRTFRLREGEPLPTSYGADSYRRIFGTDPAREVITAERP